MCKFFLDLSTILGIVSLQKRSTWLLLNLQKKQTNKNKKKQIKTTRNLPTFRLKITVLNETRKKPEFLFCLGNFHVKLFQDSVSK